MNDNQRKVIIGGLLHDIGKVLYRSDDGRNHSQSGYDFLLYRKVRLWLLSKRKIAHIKVGRANR